jgi:hypothetical protein
MLEAALRQSLLTIPPGRSPAGCSANQLAITNIQANKKPGTFMPSFFTKSRAG